MRCHSSNMEDAEGVICSSAFLAIWMYYGFKWAGLILFTILLVMFTANWYSRHKNVRKTIVSEHRKNGVIAKDFSQKNFLNEGGSVSGGDIGRSLRTIKRRHVSPASAKRDLPFTDLQMNRSWSPRHRNSLKSPEPLLSQITRHLSFSNMSYYPERTGTKETRHHNSTINKIGLENSYLLSPVKNTNISLDNLCSQRKPSLDIASSLPQERYSPRCFSILAPTLNMTQSPATVKIRQPSQTSDDSPFSFESILQKRLQRTKENPCSRQSVLSALIEKSRKRPAYEADGSFLEPSYSVKKRRRDDLDDFLDSISDPPSSSKVGRSLKRSYAQADNEESRYNSLRQVEKRFRQRQLSSEADDVSPADSNFVRRTDSTESNSSNQMTSTGDTANDSGIATSGSDDLSQKTKPKKGKTVRFSPDTQSGSSDDLHDSVTENHGGSPTPPGEEFSEAVEGETVHGSRNLDVLPVFQTRFSPRKPIHSSNSFPADKVKQKKLQRRSHLTWKDVQEHRRHAWRRSQKLLDDIEESLAKESGTTTTSVAVPLTSTSTTLASITGSSKTSQTTVVSRTVGTGVAPSLSLSPSASSIVGNPGGAHFALKPASSSTTSSSPSTIFGLSGATAGKVGDAAGTSDFKFAIPKNPVRSKLTGMSRDTATTTTTPLITTAKSSSAVSPFAGFSFSSVGSSNKQPATTNTSSLNLSTTTSTFASVATSQTSGSQPKFGTLGQTPVIPSSSAPPTVTSFSFKAPSTGGSSSVTTASLPIFSFQAPAGSAFGKTQSQATSQSTSLSSSQTKPAGVFSFTAGSGTAGVFGGGSLQTSTPSGFSFASPQVPTFGNPTTTSAAAGQSKTGGFTFTAPAVNKPLASGGFSFNQTATPTNFSFGSPTPAPGGFTFGGTAAPGTPFASSTPMPGNSGGMQGSAFTLGSSGRSETAASRAKPRRRKKQ